MNKNIDRHPDSIFRVINEKSFIMNYKTGNIVTLNDFGSVIWEKLPDSLSKIVEDIALEYDAVKDEVRKDVSEFLDFLVQENVAVVTAVGENPRHPIGTLNHLDKIEQLGIEECIPIVAKFELQYHCNLNCIHCYNITERRREKRRGTLDTQMVKHIIDQLYDIGTMVISFTGGEIFLRKDIWDIIAYADRNDFLIELLTNATLMTEADVQRLKNYRISNVQISLYSHIQGIHDSVTNVRGSYEKTVTMIKCLTANKINTTIITPLMKINFKDHREIKRLADQMGVKHYYSYRIFERNDGSKDIYDMRLSKDEIYKFYLENPDDIPYKEKDITEAICYAGTNQCSISPLGNVSPCFHALLPYSLGNLMEQSLEDIWTNSKELENLRNLKIGHLDCCRECSAIDNCIICPGLNMRATDNMLDPAQMCCDHAFSARKVVESHAVDLETTGAKSLEDFH